MRTVILLAIFSVCYSQYIFAYTGNGWKVAVIDIGIIPHSGISNSKIDDQLCYSKTNRFTPASLKKPLRDNVRGSSNPNNGYYDYIEASMCKHGVQRDLTSSNAATTPRVTWHWSNQYDWHSFGAPHGTNVAHRVINTAAGAKIIAVNNGYYDSNRKFLKKDQIVSCGIHGTDADLPKNQRNSYRDACYGLEEKAYEGHEVRNAIRARGKVAAINLSQFGPQKSCQDASKRKIFEDYKKTGIAVIAGTGNDGNGKAIKYPACDPNVISVGAIIGNAGRVALYTNDNGQIDFLANGDARDFATRSKISGTSFAAPIVAAAFAIMKEAKPSATVDQMKQALTKAAKDANSIRRHNGRDIPVVNRSIAVAAANCLAKNNCSPSEPPDSGEISHNDPGTYGPAHGDSFTKKYDFIVDFNNLQSSARANSDSTSTVTNQNVNITGQRDIVLKLKGFNSAFYVLINGHRRYTIPYVSSERTHTVYLNRNFFNPGINTVTLQPLNVNNAWGLRDIQANFLPKISLTVGRTNNGLYGYDQSPKRYNGLRASFNLNSVQTDYALYATGWDIDRNDETRVFINGRALGYLPTGGSSAFTTRKSFRIPKNYLQRGENIVEFVQRNPDSTWRGYQDEKWAVRDLLITQARPNLKVIGFTLLTRSLKPNVPFTVQTTTKNIGIGAASATTLNYYISRDKTISTADTRIASQGITGLSVNRSTTVQRTLQSALSGDNYYVGVCINVVPGESSVSDNCSSGVSLSNRATLIAPIIMLLLDDE